MLSGKLAPETAGDEPADPCRLARQVKEFSSWREGQ
jgi:hypothetical protein